VPLDGFKMQTAGAMCVTHTMSLEQFCALERLVEVGRRALHLHLPEGPSPGHLYDWLALRAQTGIGSPVRRVCWCPGQAGLSGRREP
jgi:hypothetical protein